MDKKQLAANCIKLNTSKENFKKAVTLDLAGVIIDFYLDRTMPNAAFNFLEDYYHSFLTNKPAKLSLYFKNFENPFSSPLNPLWNELDENIHFEEGLLWCRDVVAAFDIGKNEVFAMGPFFHSGAIDTLDNLLTPACAHFLIEEDVLHVHASCVEVEGKAWVFYGPSGAGKSTIAMDSLKTNNYRVLSGDQIFLKKNQGEWLAIPTTVTIYGLERDHNMWCSDSLPLAGLLFLNGKNKTFSLNPLSLQDFLMSFLKENIYFGKQHHRLLQLCYDLYQYPDNIKGELIYRRNSVDLWGSLRGELHGG